MMRSAREEVSACASVLATTKSTPDEPGHDHVVDRVAAGAADAAHHDARLQFPQFGCLQIDRHACLIPLGARGRRGDCLNRALPDPPPARDPNSFKNSPSASARRGRHSRRSRQPAAGRARGFEIFEAGHLRIDHQADRGRERRALARFRQALDAERPADPRLARDDRCGRVRAARSAGRRRRHHQPPADMGGVPGGAQPVARRVRESPRRAAG